MSNNTNMVNDPSVNKNLVKLPKIFDYNFDDPKEQKEWRSIDKDITDYFNYGFNEETWRIYVEKIKKYYSEIPVTKSIKNNNLLIDKNLPLEMGGFGDPINEQIKSHELFDSFINNLERFWLGMDLSECEFWRMFESLINEHTNAYDEVTGQYNTRNFNRHFKAIKSFEVRKGIDLSKIVSKQNYKYLKDKVAGISNPNTISLPNFSIKPSERNHVDGGFRQKLYNQAYVYDKMGNMMVGEKGDKTEEGTSKKVKYE